MRETASPIDTTFDFRSDTPDYPKRDPDKYSPTLRRYHKLLWSKPLPGGAVFTLDDTTRHYLHHSSNAGTFALSSDSVIATFAGHRRLAHILEHVSAEDREHFSRVGYTIGGMMIFPATRIAGKNNINGARGFHHKIRDRFDLTVECIRRHYSGLAHPLSDTLARYSSFFSLFGSFQGYVEFFLLQDILSDDGLSVRFFSDFRNFESSAVPQSLDEYEVFRERSLAFVQARNRRIAAAQPASRTF